jgi:hypothetical protein
MRNVFIKGVKNEADIYEVLPSFKSQKLGDKVETNWNNQRVQKDPSMLRLLWSCFGKEYLVVVVTQVFQIIIMLLFQKYCYK